MKKIISILLAVFMLASLAPAALASVESTASVSTEGYLTESFTENGPANTSIAPGFTSDYRTSIAVEPVVRDAENGDYAYKANVTVNEGTTGTNYADLRFPFTRINIADSKIKISYDVCFDEFKGNGGVALTLAATTRDSNGASTWPINRSVFVGTSDSKVLTLYGYGNQIINAGQWYHVEHVFNNKIGREDAYITGPDGYFMHTGFSYDYAKVADISRFSLSMKSAGSFTVDNVKISDGAAHFVGVEASYASTDDVKFDVVIPAKFTSALVLCDGKVVTNIAPEDGKDCYTVNVSADDADFVGGAHDVMALVTYADGTTETAKTQIKVNGSSQEAIMGSKGTALSTDVEDFNRLGAKATVSGQAPYVKLGTSPVEHNTLWQSNCDTYVIPGASGEKGDYALSLETTGKLIQIVGPKTTGFSTTPITSPDAKLVIEFDGYIKSSDTGVQFVPFGSTNNAADFISSGKIIGKIDIPVATWTHIKMVYDVATDVVEITANGQTTTKNVALKLSDGNFRFWLRSGKGFAVDNARTYVLNSDGTETGVLLKDEVTYMSTEIDTFDNLYALAYEKVEEDTRVYSIAWNVPENNTQWQANAATKLIYGPTGKDTDFGICVDKSGTLLQYRGMANPAATKGYFVMDFDFKILSDGVQINSENIGTDAANFLGGNSLLGAPIKTGEWTHFTLKYDVVNGVMYVISNGKTYTRKMTFSMAKGYIRLTLKAGAGFAIDNTKVYNEIPDASIVGAQYVANGEAVDAAANVIPANATELKITTDSALSLEPSDIELYVDDAYAEIASFETNGNVISIALPALEANTDLKLVLKNSIEGLSNDVAQSFLVADANGNFVKAEEAIFDNSMIRNIVRHYGSASYKAISATYIGDAFANIKTADIKASSAPTASIVNITGAGADSAKLMLWDSMAGLKPVIPAVETAIAE